MKAIALACPPFALALALVTGAAHAADSTTTSAVESASAASAMIATPIVVYTYQATGAPAHTVGAQAYGLGSAASGGVGLTGDKGGIVGGGITVWGSPIDRLTLVGDAVRDATGNFAPSAAAIVRLVGNAASGFSLGALAKFKVEGFGVGKNDEIESEVEGGLLFSVAEAGWHADLNAVTGFGTGDDGEIDSEARLRVGRDLGESVRVGIDGQARYRLAGDEKLVGARAGDFAGGPQIVVGSGPFFGALTGGPSTVNVFHGIGWTGVITIGGAVL